MFQRFIFRCPHIFQLRRLEHDLPHDPNGLLQKGRAEENIYFRKKERDELLRMRHKLERLERTQQQLKEKLEMAQQFIEELQEVKDNSNDKKPGDRRK